jgi:hypothetical protein
MRHPQNLPRVQPGSGLAALSWGCISRLGCRPVEAVRLSYEGVMPLGSAAGAWLLAAVVMAQPPVAGEPRHHARPPVSLHGSGWKTPDTLEAHRERLVALISNVGVAGHDPDRLRQVRTAPNLRAASEAVDDLTVLHVDINPEARVKLRPRTLPETLVQHRRVRLLVEVRNEAGLQAPLRLRAFDRAEPGEQEAAWFAVRIVENGESRALLSGAPVEWKLVELRCAAAGTRAVRIAADAGVGTQDLGFRAEVDLIVDVKEVP